MPKLDELLKGATLVALPDVHTMPTARAKAKALIESGKVKVFFIEWNHERGSCYSGEKRVTWEELSQPEARDEMKWHDAADVTKFLIDNGCFEGIDPLDASPTLPELAGLAVFHGVKVVPADADPEGVKHQLDTRSDDALYNSDGLKIRDAFAGEHIAEYLSNPAAPTVGRLMLWGDNHFNRETHSDGRSLADIITAENSTIPVHVATDEEMK